MIRHQLTKVNCGLRVRNKFYESHDSGGCKGTRVRPITYRTQTDSHLAKPVMEFLLELLRQHGFDQIINVSHLANEIENYFRDGQRFEIAYSFEANC